MPSACECAPVDQLADHGLVAREAVFDREVEGAPAGRLRDPSPQRVVANHSNQCRRHLIYGVNGITHYFLVPGEIPLAFDLGEVLVEEPWRAMAPYTAPFVFELSPLLVGIVYLMSVEVAFSTWFFFLVSRLQLLAVVVQENDQMDRVDHLLHRAGMVRSRFHWTILEVEE